MIGKDKSAASTYTGNSQGASARRDCVLGRNKLVVAGAIQSSKTLAGETVAISDGVRICIWMISKRFPAAMALPAPVAAPTGTEVAPAVTLAVPG